MAADDAIQGVKPSLPSDCKQGIVVNMTSVSITDLKANLSRYIRELRNGGEIEVLNRGMPVARISSPILGADEDLDALVRSGLLTRGNGRADEMARKVLSEPPVKLAASLSEALAEDRNDRL